MRILGIDPSNTRHAWALLEVVGPMVPPTLKGFGRDLTLDCFRDRDMSADRVIIEMIASYGMAVGAHTFDTCVEIGKLLVRFPKSERITRVEVKRIVCRSVTAKDSNVRAACVDRFGGPSAIKKGGQLYGVSKDTWAALAVALAAASGEARWYQPVADKEMLE